MAANAGVLTLNTAGPVTEFDGTNRSVRRWSPRGSPGERDEHVEPDRGWTSYVVTRYGVKRDSG
jgi:hypothetical protein